MTTDFVLAVVAIGLTFTAIRSSYYILRFFAGVAWWGLGVWWIYNPLMAGSNPVNDIVMILCFFGGFAMMLMMAWGFRTVNGRETGSFNVRLPQFLGGQPESEEEETITQTRNSRERRADYTTRANAATRGRRIRTR
jgi:hypothetical protein